jgi:hypothetical protein
MQQKLAELYLADMQSMNATAPNFYLMAFSRSISKVLHFVEQTPEALYADRALRKIFAKDGWQTNCQTLEEFFQLVGEVEFWMLANERGVNLARVAEASHPTPDFQILNPLKDSPQFEVKTFSVTDGERALQKMSDDSLNSQIELEKQVIRGVQVAMGAHVVAPHGYMRIGADDNMSSLD